jgi:tryptophan halogenase
MALGRRESHEAYSLAATAARAGRFARPMSQSALTSSFTYAFHVDESAYTAYVREHAEKLGVRRIAGKIGDVALTADGDISALIVDGGERLEADFFIDCSGREALLMNRVSSEAREDWSEWLPNDRMLSTRAPAMEEARALTETNANEIGWFWRLPLAHSSAVGFVYSSAFLSDDLAADQLRGHSSRGHSSSSRSVPIEVADDIACTRLSQGRRKLLWERNCLALGEAAIEVEPLAGANLHMAQLGIATFIELFPIERTTRLEAIEYNRIVGEYADSLRDFTVAHYRVASRPGDYWTSTRAAELPSRLRERLDLYSASGRLNLLDNEIFDELDWAWLLIGSGYLPQRIGVHTRSALDGVRVEDLAPMRDSITRLAASMPRHMDFVRQHG